MVAVFEKLVITHSGLNANINISHLKLKILEAIGHLKDISRKRSDVGSIFGFITRKIASNWGGISKHDHRSEK